MGSVEQRSAICHLCDVSVHAVDYQGVVLITAISG